MSLFLSVVLIHVFSQIIAFVTASCPPVTRRATLPFLDPQTSFPWEDPAYCDFSRDSLTVLDDLDYYDFVVKKLQPWTEPSAKASSPSVSESKKHAVPRISPSKESDDEDRGAKVATKPPVCTASESKDSNVQTEEQGFLLYYVNDLFPDPFQAYVFSALLFWFAVTIVLLKKEWSKSRRIVAEVFLLKGPEAIQLVEDRYKDQLNLPNEYSLLS